MTPPAERMVDQELAAKLFAAKKLEDPGQAVRVWWDRTWSDDGNERCKAREAELRAALEALGLAEIDATRVKAVSVSESTARFPETGTLEFPRAFENAADSVAGMADRPNDFTFTVRLPYSEELDVVVQYESEEAGLICGDCHRPGSGAEIIDGESCEHLRDECDIRIECHVMLVRQDHRLSPGCYGHTHFP